ncbi:MAG: glutaminyl-peptide cyclotransferase [Pseudomonadales bacterium]|jgi:glutamine cyclotransferase|nr:glutaminyl-peptide cyclotransferase [Pseudomonadales bacterium]
MLRYRGICGLLLLGATLACAEAPLLPVEVVAQYPHDAAAFTQGLVIDKGELFEGTGLNGQSTLRRVDLETGAVLQQQKLGERYFGEGITILGDKIYQLTWQTHVGFVYSRDDFQQLSSFYLPGEGWGLTHDGKELIVSDGTAMLRFLDPVTLKETHRVAVNEDGVPLTKLNELEYINGEVWANVWYTDYIVRIDPVTGKVLSKLDLSSLHPQSASDDVLNGIAWDADAKRLFVTGKLWPHLYEIRVRE